MTVYRKISTCGYISWILLQRANDIKLCIGPPSEHTIYCIPRVLTVWNWWSNNLKCGRYFINTRHLVYASLAISLIFETNVMALCFFGTAQRVTSAWGKVRATLDTVRNYNRKKNRQHVWTKEWTKSEHWRSKIQLIV